MLPRGHTAVASTCTAPARGVTLLLIPIGCDEAVFSTDRAFWIPAYAGMTDELVVSQLIHGVFKMNWYKSLQEPPLCISPPPEERLWLCVSLSRGGITLTPAPASSAGQALSRERERG